MHCSKRCAVLKGPHSITSSARASSEGGTVRPSAFAVLRLITSSNLVGCSTGKSAGLCALEKNAAKIESLPRLTLGAVPQALLNECAEAAESPAAAEKSRARSSHWKPSLKCFWPTL